MGRPPRKACALHNRLRTGDGPAGRSRHGGLLDSRQQPRPSSQSARYQRARFHRTERRYLRAGALLSRRGREWLTCWKCSSASERPISKGELLSCILLLTPTITTTLLQSQRKRLALRLYNQSLLRSRLQLHFPLHLLPNTPDQALHLLTRRLNPGLVPPFCLPLRHLS
jgi:hypothetical protein